MTYACLLPKPMIKTFGIAEFQIDNIFHIRMEIFINKKEIEYTEAKFKAKLQTILKIGILKNFNCCCIIIKAKSIIVVQKNKIKKLVLIDIKNNAKKQQYVKQHIQKA